MPNETPASRLKDCKDRLEQAQLDAERNKGLAEELERVRLELEELRERPPSVALSMAERRRFRELLTDAENQRDDWTRRGVAAEQKLQQYTQLLQSIAQLIKDKECLLPQIAQLLRQL